jgi:hypothetical protein
VSSFGSLSSVGSLSSLGSGAGAGAAGVDFSAMVVKASAPSGPRFEGCGQNAQEIAVVRKKIATGCRKYRDLGWCNRLQPLIFEA